MTKRFLVCAITVLCLMLAMGFAVNAQVSGIGVNMGAMTLEKGNDAQLYATVMPESELNSAVMFTSVDTTVASVTAGGKVSANGVGKTKVLVQSVNNPLIMTSCDVTVVDTISNNYDVSTQILEIVHEEDGTYTCNIAINVGYGYDRDTVVPMIALYDINGVMLGTKIGDELVSKEGQSITQNINIGTSKGNIYRVKCFAMESLEKLIPVANFNQSVIDDTTVTEKKDIGTIYGIVAANSVTSLTSSLTALPDNKVIIDVINSNIDEIQRGCFISVITDTNLSDKIGYRICANVIKNDDLSYTVTSYTLSNNKVAEIDNTGDIVAVSSAKYPSVIGSYYNLISVFNSDNDITNTMYDLDDDAAVIFNGKYLCRASDSRATDNIYAISGAATTLGQFYAPRQGKVTLIDNNNDNLYDVMFVKSYETLVVDEVYSNNEKIACKDGNTVIDLSGECSYSITLDGKQIMPAELKENDVLSVAVTCDHRYVDIIVSRKVVTGQIEAINPTQGKYIVSGTEYEIANVANHNDVFSSGITVGDEGIFYLDTFGKIARFKQTATDINYGFVVAADDYSSAGKRRYEVKLLDKDGVMNTYTLKDTVKFTDATGVPTNSAKDSVVYNALWALNSTVYYDATGTAVDTWVLTDDLYTDATHSASSKVTAAALRNAMAQRLVTFKLNSSDEITEVTFAKSSNDKYKFSFYGVASSKYKSSTTSFGGSVGVTDETVVFLIPTSAGTTSNDYAVSTIAGLSDDETYEVAFYTVDDDLNASAIVVTGDNAEVPVNTTLAVITELMKTTDSSSNDIYNVTFMQNGETKTLATSSDAASFFGSAAKGDIFEYAVDGNGNIDKVSFAKKGDHHGMTTAKGTISAATIAAKIAGGTLADTVLSTTLACHVPYYEYSSDGAKAQYVFGQVVAKTASSKLIQLAPVAVDGSNPGTITVARHVIPDTANIIMVDLNRASTSELYVRKGEFSEIKAAEYYPSTDYFYPNMINPEKDNCVLIKYYNDVITDVIIYNGFITKYFNAGV